MKLLLALFAFLSISAHAQGVDPMPWLKGTNPSPDALAVLQKVNEARQEGKDLLILSSAAWCPPCARLDHEFEINKAGVAKLKETTKIVGMEYENILVGFADHLPTRQFYFPTIYFYSHTGNFWRAINAGFSGDLVADVTKLVEETRANGEHTSSLLKGIKEDIAKGVVFASPEDETAEDPVAKINMLFKYVLLDLSSESLKATTVELVKTFLANPKQFPFFKDEDASYYSMMAVKALINQGTITADEVNSLSPAILSYAAKSPGNAMAQLRLEINGEYHRAGAQAAARLCDARRGSVFSGFKPETEGLQSAAYILEGVCHQLARIAGDESRGRQLRDHLLRAQSALSEKAYGSALASLNRLAASSGNYDLALSTVEPSITSDKESHDESISKLKTKVAEAKMNKDQAKADEYQGQIDLEEVRFKRVMDNYELQKAAWKSGKQPAIVHDI